MSQAFPRARRLTRATAVTAIACSATLAGASAAQAACATQTTTKAYASFGDNADYVLAPGGNFEAGAARWSLSGASLTAATAPFAAGAKTDRGSLTVSGRGLAISPPFCVGVEHPNFRLQARQVSGSWAQLLVKLRWSMPGSTKTNDTVVGSLSGSAFAKWTPAPSMKLAETLPVRSAVGQSVTAQIVLDPEDYGGGWQVDNVYIDPYRRN